jgi:hypothetical protein
VFKIGMMGKQIEHIENVEKIIESFKVKPERRSVREVTFVKGSIANGYRTAFHCDCDHVKTKKNKDGMGVQLLHYPDLFMIIIEHQRVRNIQVHLYWGEEKENLKDEKITISEFLRQNNAFELSADVSYKILKEKYY